MTDYVKLDNVEHRDLTVAIAHGARFGDGVNQLLVFPTEFEQLQRELPVVFRRDAQGSFHAVALVGLDRDDNLFLRDDCWTTRYVPVIGQRGPFALDAQGQVTVDRADPRVGAAGGEPLFLRHGGQAPYLRHIIAVLDALKRGRDSAAPFFAALARHGLIRPVTMELAIDDDTQYVVPDVFTVDADRLATLDGDALAGLHRSGVLRAATMAAASLDNVAQLIERQRLRIAA